MSDLIPEKITKRPFETEKEFEKRRKKIISEYENEYRYYTSVGNTESDEDKKYWYSLVERFDIEEDELMTLKACGGEFIGNFDGDDLPQSPRIENTPDDEDIPEDDDDISDKDDSGSCDDVEDPAVFEEADAKQEAKLKK